MKIRICITILALLLFPTSAGAFLDNPVISAWMPVSWDTEEARKSFRDNINLYDEISPFQYNLLEDGTVGLYANANDASLIREAHDAGIEVIPTITNNFSAEKAHTVLIDSEKRTALIQELILLVEDNNYDGIDIDFEGLFVSDGDAFTAFMRELAHELHTRNKILSTAIQAKTSDNANNSSAAQDWDAIGAVVDRFRIMTYDFHWQSSGAGSISPVSWIKEVAAFAEQHVPHEKIIMGIPFYGYNWPCRPGDWNDCGRAMSAKFTQAEGWLDLRNVPVGWDEENEEPYFTYILNEAYKDSPTTERIVYFQNAASIHSKLTALQEKQVNGIAIWRLGDEDPGNFESIALVMRAENTQPDFADVPSDFWSYEYIQPLRNKRVVNGIDNSFFPHKTVSLAEAVKMTLRLSKLPTLTYETTQLNDVPSDDWTYNYLQTVILRKWIDPPVQGIASPHQSLTRAAAVALLARATNLNLETPSAHFSDVDENSPMAIYINAAKTAGWINGYGDGTFKPTQLISRAEFAKVLTKAVD